MSQLTMSLTIHYSWWLKPFLKVCIIAHRLGFRIDEERVKNIMLRGVKPMVGVVNARA